MKDDSISVIIPTIGRLSLAATLDSMIHQIDDDDQVIVVGDGPQPVARSIAGAYDGKVKYLETPERANDFGATPRNFGIDVADRPYLAFMDDDDVYLPGAFGSIKDGLRQCPGRPHLYRMIWMQNVIWSVPAVFPANVGTHMVILPNVKSKLARWKSHYEADFDFICETGLLYPPEMSYVFREEVIACLTKHRKGL